MFLINYDDSYTAQGSLRGIVVPSCIVIIWLVESCQIFQSFTSTIHAIMESDIEENRRRQMEEIEALSSIYEENFILGNMI